MEINELVSRVRGVELRMRKRVERGITGGYKSAFRGGGLDFEEVRAYQYGDEVRAIDWNVTARLGEVYVKVFREERELQVLVLNDVSGSMRFGKGGVNKFLAGVDICAMLGFGCLRNNDRFGLVGWGDGLVCNEGFGKGKGKIFKTLRGLLAVGEGRGETDLGAGLHYVENILKRRSLVFVISDFLDEDYEGNLVRLGLRNEVVLVRLFHPGEVLGGFKGFLPIIDAESGVGSVLFGGLGNEVGKRFKEVGNNLKRLAGVYGFGFVELDISQDYMAVFEGFISSWISKRFR